MIPYTVDRRPDTRLTNVEMGIWLFLASEVMLFGALFSSYALLRTAAPTWPSGREVLSLPLGLINTVILAIVSVSAWRARHATRKVWQRRLAFSSLAAVAFLVVKGFEYSWEIESGLVPSVSLSMAMYFLLTGMHALHVFGGFVANVWAIVARRRGASDALSVGRGRAIALYWLFVDVVWLVILVLLYLT